jgi:tetratricopeptide (TPR) repeat protein
MSATPATGRRQLVPRWRAWKLTAAMGELGSSHGQSSSQDALALLSARQMEALERQYHDAPSPARANEVVGSALVAGYTSEAVDAIARGILEGHQAGSVSYRMAEYLLAPEAARLKHSLEEVSPLPDRNVTIHRAGRLKEIVRQEPRNALRWVDLSREHLTLGQPQQAAKEMSVALHLAPHNRFVLRSAVRLRLQSEDIASAIGLLQGAPQMQSDPWLLAPAVALADLGGMKQRKMKTALRMISNDDYAAWDVAELAGAVATVELGSGGGRRARQHMRRALEDPTENVLAQAEWFGEDFGVDTVMAAEGAPRTFEALARRAGTSGDWARARTMAAHWLGDLPFSEDAATYASWAACQEDHFQDAAIYAEIGLRTNPESATLMNNRAFALIRLGQLDDAVDLLLRARRVSPDADDKACLLATEGAALFHGGYLEEGRSRYLEAIESFSRRGAKDKAAMAWLLLAEAETLTLSGPSAETWRRVERAAAGNLDPAVSARWQWLTSLSRPASFDSPKRSSTVGTLLSQ